MECSQFCCYDACFVNANFRTCVLAVSRFQRTGWPISCTSPIVFTMLFSIMLGLTRTQLLHYSIKIVHGRTNERTDRQTDMSYDFMHPVQRTHYEEGKNGLDRKKEQKGKNKKLSRSSNQHSCLEFGPEADSKLGFLGVLSSCTQKPWYIRTVGHGHCPHTISY